MMNLSSCGLVCDDCEFFGNACASCLNIKGYVFWAKESIPGGVCPLYSCAVNQKNFRNCGDCAELPCRMFREMKDPNSTMEEHLKSIEERMKRMRKPS